MTEATPTCPECSGPLLPGHPAGLVYRHATLSGCSLQDAEDARLVADKERAGPRPTTPTERILLAAAGITVPEDGTCLVEWITPGCRRRTFLGAVA